MDLMHPYVIYIGIPIILVLSIVTFSFRRKKKYKDGKKVANSEFIENTSYFKWRIVEYRICKVVSVVSLALAMSFLTGALARPYKTSENITEIRNRDIFLCLDTSGSMTEVDLQVCEKMREVVKGLKGERFGITIFNCQTVTLVPLTTDYDYVIEVLDQIEEACRIALGEYGEGYYSEEDYAKYKFIEYGTITYDYDSGSSLLGDGLASTVFQFPDIKEDDSRTRVIVLCTDNELFGQPFVELSEAAELCVKYKIKVFAAAPEYVVDYDEYKRCVVSTGGQIFTLNSDSVAKDMVRAIDNTETSVLLKSETVTTEYPEKLVALIAICLFVHFLVSRRIKL